MESLTLNGIRSAANECEALVVTKSADFADLGTFMQAWQVSETESGALLTNFAPHAGVVEEGSRPHWPPFFPMLDYLARKQGISLVGLSDPGTSGPYGMAGNDWFAQSPEREKLRLQALSVCRAIAAHGTKPKRMLGSSQDDFARIVERHVSQVLNGAGA
ncbi:hypothetical protein IT570_03565 [Candidatus Sumerlaeota bacterium]|nr:hypothetical protein [Candidatus Sumerlaeota bacterium]